MYQTGDYASVQKDGLIHFEGRIDSQVRGHRVDLDEIQKHLLEINGVTEAVVLCHRLGEMNQEILAFFCVESTNMNEIRIGEILRSKLPEFMKPRIVIVDDLPLSSNGKANRQLLLKMYENLNNNNNTKFEHNFCGVPQNKRRMA